MAGLTLDAGALIAVERGDERLRFALVAVRQEGGELVVPAPVLAQEWRGATSVRLALLLRSCGVAVFDERQARAVGQLLGRAGTSDVVDGSVVVTAAERGHAVLTDDLGDIAPLADALDRHIRVLPLRRMR